MHRYPILRHCPNLLRMSVAKRIQLLDKLTEGVKICQRCSNPYEGECKACNRIPYVHICKKSNLHPIFCACITCAERVDIWKGTYNEKLGTGPKNINQLNLDTAEKMFLPTSPILLQHDEYEEGKETPEEEPIEKNEQIKDVFTTIEEFDNQIDETLKIFGSEYSKQQATEFISKFQG